MRLPHVDMNGMSLTVWSSLWNAARVAQAARLCELLFRPARARSRETRANRWVKTLPFFTVQTK
jgi:hypothetical protein